MKTLESWLGRLVEWLAAALVMVEICVLLAGVISRYVFHHAFVWSDELASILFLWLAMFGAVLALQKGEHMRLTAIVGGMSPRWQARAEALAVAAPALFLLLLLPWAQDYAADEFYIETPALGWSNEVRAAALPVFVGAVRRSTRATATAARICFAPRSRRWRVDGPFLIRSLSRARTR